MTIDFDQQYLPSRSVAGTELIFLDWKHRATATQAKFSHTADIRYGAHPREVMDFYPAKDALGCVVYIHGGYWSSFSKFETCWVAEGFVEQGLSVGLINYPLCPEVTIGDIRNSCIRAFAHLYAKVINAEERKHVVMTGHSAGGYLAAAMLTEDWTQHGLPHDPFAGVISISGVFDLDPLLHTRMRDDLRLTEASARELNLMRKHPLGQTDLVLAVGERESEEFHRQSHDFARIWAALSPQVTDVKGANHFTIVDDLASSQGGLNNIARQMAKYGRL